MDVIDCRGLACPGPVIQAKKTLENLSTGSSFVMDVDSEASRENVTRFARTRGASVSVTETDEGVFRLTVRKNASSETGAASPSSVVFVTSDVLGAGDDKLGGILMEGFINTLLDQDIVPDKIIFMNSGVRMAAKGSPVIEALKTLTNRGCEILSCGTCLEYFSLKNELAVGAASNMFDIQNALLNATSVIRP